MLGMLGHLTDIPLRWLVANTGMGVVPERLARYVIGVLLLAAAGSDDRQYLRTLARSSAAVGFGVLAAYVVETIAQHQLQGDK